MSPTLTLPEVDRVSVATVVLRDDARTYLGRLDREELSRRDVGVVDVVVPTVLPQAVLLSGEMPVAEALGVIPLRSGWNGTAGRA